MPKIKRIIENALGIGYNCGNRPLGVELAFRKRMEILSRHPVGRVIDREIDKRLYGKVISLDGLDEMIDDSYRTILAPCSCREYSGGPNRPLDPRDRKELYFEFEDGGLANLYAGKTKENYEELTRSQAKEFVEKKDKNSIFTIPVINLGGEELPFIDVCTCCSRRCVLIDGYLNGSLDLLKRPEDEDVKFAEKLENIIKRPF